MTELHLDHTAAGRDHRVAPGDVVVVRLNETATSGYRWEADSYEPAVLELEEAVPRPSGDPRMRSAPGQREFRFRVRAAGAAHIRLVRRRSWTDAPPAETFETTLRADPA